MITAKELRLCDKDTKTIYQIIIKSGYSLNAGHEF